MDSPGCYVILPMRRCSTVGRIVCSPVISSVTRPVQFITCGQLFGEERGRKNYYSKPAAREATVQSCVGDYPLSLSSNSSYQTLTDLIPPMLWQQGAPPLPCHVCGMSDKNIVVLCISNISDVVQWSLNERR